MLEAMKFQDENKKVLGDRENPIPYRLFGDVFRPSLLKADSSEGSDSRKADGRRGEISSSVPFDEVDDYMFFKFAPVFFCRTGTAECPGRGQYLLTAVSYTHLTLPTKRIV
eukprot:TRINITY_DN38842_c0_g1_i1.p1 TRINITY_DN38842_c0_g1~~TRINITY_DN38842_c0_g1_i1.p1  ORF type:complete len:111 (-),score=27.03 TRINITY_DN38842_c0_g1_i1:63-395(-)